MKQSSIWDADDPANIAEEAGLALRSLLGVENCDIAVVLGSGWKDAADSIGETIGTVSAVQVRGFPDRVVPGHNPSLRAVHIHRSDKVAFVVGARNHFYDSQDANRTVHGIRVAAALGVKRLVLTNGAGSLNPSWKPGQPVLISDQINLTGATPLAGADFVDLTGLYSPHLRQVARQVDADLPEGVYVQFPGPQYETPAEIRMVHAFGGDLVGMSTALEAIAARAAGMEILGLSLVTNLAAGISPTPLSHGEVLAVGRQASSRLKALLTEILSQI